MGFLYLHKDVNLSVGTCVTVLKKLKQTSAAIAATYSGDALIYLKKIRCQENIFDCTGSNMFEHRFRTVQEMRLTMYRNGQNVLDFAAYLIARGVCNGVVKQHIGTAKKALEFCDTQAEWPHTGELFTCYSR